jgi:5-formyltetrahydrofolate cyclo-ligase
MILFSCLKMDISSTKQQIRKHMKKIISLISQEEKSKKSLLLTDLLIDLFKQKAVNTVAFFLPFVSEPNVLPALERCQQQGITIVLPHTDRQKSMFMLLDGYKDNENNTHTHIDIILVP